MNEFVRGENVIRRVDSAIMGRQNLGSGPYQYDLYQFNGSATLDLKELGSMTVYVFDCDPNSRVVVRGTKHVLAKGDCIQAEDAEVTLDLKGSRFSLLVAGTTLCTSETAGVSVVRNQDLYRVEKPWGHELWINGRHPGYCLKEIFITSGTKTSLQYHHFKQETNALFKGTAKLHYRSNEDVPIDDVTPADVSDVELQAPSTISVTPGVLHRLEAVSDILLCEVSTPHLDDVIRVSDDSQRPDGLITSEHR